MGKRHRGPDPIEMNYGKEAQRAGSHRKELWEKDTEGLIPLKLIMGKRHSGPDPIELDHGKKAQRAGSH